ncbi:MAG: Conjugative transfer protein TrbL [Afipia sp.]|jgi:ParB family chromosome partitioning protein|nr:MAG: Conjugative transfer protein TrbL [Afipia sp.]
MATAVQKIKLSPSRDIPFNKLVLSQSNVRRVKAGVSVEQLAESIAQRTLLQGLNVRAVVDAEGHETGMFEVPAGGRRYRALELLVKQKRMAKTQPVPCVVRDGGIAEDDSLAENDERVGLHPLDQFRTFKLLRDGGMSEEDIAARHFVTPAIVKQRLRLASVSPKLHDVYAADDMTLEQLMAFSVVADHARQEQVWDSVSSSQLDEPYQIRRMLTENTVRASDRRAQFIGLDAYEQAGGAVMRDLFEHDDGGWLQDVPLLDRLVTDKLRAEAETIAAEGWKWVAVAVDFPYGHTNGLRELDGEPVDLTPEEQATLDALNVEYAKIEQDYQDADELPNEIDQRLGEIEAARAAFDARSLRYDQAAIARAGVFISIDAEGFLLVDRGYVRPEDEAPVVDDPETEADTAEGRTGDGQAAAGGIQRAVITIGGAPVEPVDEDDDDDDTIKPLPDRLITELTAHRTLALRDALANAPAIAFQAVLHNFVLATFYRFASSSGCLEIAIRTPTFPPQAPGLKESISAAGGAVMAGGAAAGMAVRGAGAAMGATAAAARGGAALAGGASTSYGLASAGQSGASGVASGLSGVARAGAAAATRPVSRAASRAAGAMAESYRGGARSAAAATGGSSTMGTIGGVNAGDAAASPSSPPAWAQRMKRHQTMSHGATAAAHAVRSGDSHGGGASISLRQDER